MMLVSLAQAKLRTKFDTDAADDDIELAIKGASRMVLNHIGSHAEGFFDSSGEIALDSAGVAIDIPEDIQNATLYLAAWMIRNPDSDPGKEFSDLSFLPKPVIAMLVQYRTPTVA